jgi:hypothetical protein
MIDSQGSTACTSCLGSGRLIDSECLDCNGSGQRQLTLKEVCPRCHGDGVVKMASAE